MVLKNLNEIIWPLSLAGDTARLQTLVTQLLLLVLRNLNEIIRPLSLVGILPDYKHWSLSTIITSANEFK